MSSPNPDPQVPSPPGEMFAPERIDISHRAAWTLVLVFLLLLGVPPLVQDIRELRKGPQGWLPARELGRALTGTAGPDQPIEQRLRSFDAGVARLEFTTRPRQWAQQIVTELLRRGNDRTFPGQDGWWFYRPELQALTGYGPVKPEPHSVSRDPGLLDWEAPLAPIRAFAADLRDRGVALWLVPVPMKPSIYPEKLTGNPTDGPLRHPDTVPFFEALAGTGLRVIDLAPELWKLKTADATEGPVYLPDDTHWAPRGMAHAAAVLGRLVQEEAWFATLPPQPYPGVAAAVESVRGYGDLVEKLGARTPGRLFQPYQVMLQRWLAPGPPQSPPPDRNSPVVLLGDSFVNIFDDPTLGFAAPGLAEGQRSGAGLAQQLAQRLGRPLDVQAVNGDGASGVRRWLANRGETVVRSKKLVIWVIAERDLILSRSLAKSNAVHWKHTPIAPDPAPGTDAPVISADGAVVVEARLLEKARQANPASANYPNSLYTARYEILKTLSGPAAPATVEVVHWNFRRRTLEPTAQLSPGKTYRLELKSWAAQTDLQSINLEILGDEDPQWFSSQATELPAAGSPAGP